VAVHVGVFWEQTQLSVVDLSSFGELWLGDGSEGPVDAIVPAEMLGAVRAPLIQRDETGRALLALLPQAVLVREPSARSQDVAPQAVGWAPPKGTRWLELALPSLALPSLAEVVYGKLRFRIETHVARAPLPRHSAALRRVGALCALSVLLHALAATICWLDTPAPVDAFGLTEAQHALVQRYLVKIDSDEVDLQWREAEPFGRNADDRVGGGGTRAKGEEGAMAWGADRSKPNMRYGTRGPGSAKSKRGGAVFGLGMARGAEGNSGQHARGEALRDVAEFGTIGLLNGGNAWASSADAPQLAAPHHSAQSYTLPPQAPIDPNGRFSTTYRPGGGHLAAFEAALSRGVVSITTRQLVGDVAAAHAPAVAIASDRALGCQVDIERAKLPPGGGPTHMRIALRSTPRGAARRPPLSVHLLVDTSGSMQGPSIAQAKRAAHRLVRLLAPSDELSLVAFANDAKLAVAPGPIRGRVNQIHSAIDALEAGGSTNIGAGLTLSYKQASGRAGASKRAAVVMVLSDGRATTGMLRGRSLASLALEAFQGGVQTSTLGLGSDYDEQLMSSLAADGAGGYYYLRDADQIGGAMHKEIAQRLDPAATALEVRIRLADGVQLLHVYGARRLGRRQAARERAKEVAADRDAERRTGIARDRQQDRAGGMRFFIPTFARADRHALLIQIRAPRGEERRRLGTVELKYKDHVFGRNQTEELPIWGDYADSDAASARSIDAAVSRTVQAHLAGEDLMRSARLLTRGNSAAAATVLAERQKILQQAASSLHDNSLLLAANRLARLKVVAEAGAGMDPRARSLVLQTAARSHLR